MPTSETRRFHAFDALRAAAMELGLVLHAGVPYTRACPDSWVVCDASRSALFDLLNTVIHAFRMPVFFVMSGFFAALLLEKVGLRAFLAHRLRRIGIPLLVAIAVGVPVTRAIWLSGAFVGPDAVEGRFWPSVMHHFQTEGLRVFETIWHLWFLEYLLLLTAGFLAVRAIGRGERFADAASRRLVARGRALWLALPTAVAMWPMAGWNVDGVASVVPVPHMLGYYGIFFAAGVLLYRRRDDLAPLVRDWRLQLVVAFVAVLPFLVVAGQVRLGVGPALDPWIDGAGRVASALLTALLVFGLVGGFLELMDQDSARRRYLSDAAYFVYLTHFPLIALLGVGASLLPLPAVVEFVAILAIAAALLLALYHTLVRTTFVGRTLHGPR